MAPDTALRPPEAALVQLRASIVTIYSAAQSFLSFMFEYNQRKIKMDAAFKLKAAQGHVDRLADGERQLQQVVDDCERYCSLSNRSCIGELVKLVAEFPHEMRDQV